MLNPCCSSSIFKVLEEINLPAYLHDPITPVEDAESYPDLFDFHEDVQSLGEYDHTPGKKKFLAIS